MESIRRFAVAWDNAFRSDILADLVASLEQLLVRDEENVSKKIRVRAGHLLAASSAKRRAIAADIRDAYRYRSRVFHGGYVFDNVWDWRLAKRLKKAKGKHGNPFHDVNEVGRLIHAIARYYRAILTTTVDHDRYEYDWASQGL